MKKWLMLLVLFMMGCPQTGLQGQEPSPSASELNKPTPSPTPKTGASVGTNSLNVQVEVGNWIPTPSVRVGG